MWEFFDFWGDYRPFDSFIRTLPFGFNFRTRLRISAKCNSNRAKPFSARILPLLLRETVVYGRDCADDDHAMLFCRHGKPSSLRCTSLLFHGNHRQYLNRWSPILPLYLPTFLDRNRYRQVDPLHLQCRCRVIVVVAYVSRPNQALTTLRESLKTMFLMVITGMLSPSNVLHRICKTSSVPVRICRLINSMQRQVWGFLVSSPIGTHRTSSFLNCLRSRGGNIPHRHSNSIKAYNKRSSNDPTLAMHRLMALTTGVQ